MKEVILPPLPKSKVENVHLELNGNINYYRNVLLNSAAGHRLGGNIRMLGKNRAKMVVAGTTKHLTSFLQELIKIAPKLNVTVTAQNEWDSLLMYKFEMPEQTASIPLDCLRRENMEMREEIETLKKELAAVRNGSPL